MRIEISDLLVDRAENTVRFTSGIGQGGGTWKGQFAPTPGAAYDIEFTILPALEIGTNCSFVSGTDSSIRTDGKKVWIVGTLEALDADKVGYLRLAPDCLMMAEFGDHNLDSDSQIELALGVSDILIYPIGS